MNKDHRELYVVSWTLRLGALRHILGICKKQMGWKEKKDGQNVRT